MTDEAKEKMNQ